MNTDDLYDIITDLKCRICGASCISAIILRPIRRGDVTLYPGYCEHHTPAAVRPLISTTMAEGGEL